jgi:tripartite-type tricarboxylate transporter receptor subunit TctC
MREFAPVSMVCVSPLYMTVNAAVPVSSIKELVAYAKANPGKVNYSSNGVGGTQHLGVELFANRAGIELVHVPYKSGAQSTQDVVSGVVNMMFGGALMLPQAKAGKVKILASGGMQRTRATPDVPTMHEAGFPGFDVSSWFALMVPAATPRPIVDRLHRETEAILKTASGSGSNDIEYQSSTPEQLASRIRNDLQVWTRVIKQTGVKP